MNNIKNLTNLQKELFTNYLIDNYEKLSIEIKNEISNLFNNNKFEFSLEEIEIELGVNPDLEIYNMYDVYLGYLEYKSIFSVEKELINFNNQDELNAIKDYIESKFSNSNDHLDDVTIYEETITNFAYMIKDYIHINDLNDEDEDDSTGIDISDMAMNVDQMFLKCFGLKTNIMNS